MLLFVNNLKKPWEPVFFSDQPSTNPQKTSHVGWRESDHHMDGSLVACQYQLLYLPTLQGLGSWTWTKKHIYYNYMHLEPKWGLLLWLEFRPCLVRLIFKNRSYLGSRYIYIIYIYTSKIQWTPPTKNEIKPLPQNETLTKIYGIRKPGSLEEMSLVESGPQGFEESLWPSYICIGHIWYMWT